MRLLEVQVCVCVREDELMGGGTSYTLLAYFSQIQAAFKKTKKAPFRVVKEIIVLLCIFNCNKYVRTLVITSLQEKSSLSQYIILSLEDVHCSPIGI